jgi:hypothetical protein
VRERIFDLSRLCGGVMISIFGTAILFLADESFILDPSNEEKTFPKSLGCNYYFNPSVEVSSLSEVLFWRLLMHILTLLFSNYAQFCFLSEKTNDYEMYY